MKKIIAYLIITLFLFNVVFAQSSTIDSGGREGIARQPAIAANVRSTTTAQVGETVDGCIERLSKTYSDISKEALRKKCELRNVKALKPAVRITKVKELGKEDFREFQKQQLQVAIDKCKEKNLDSELCENKLEKRVQLVDKLKEKDLERLQKVEGRKIQKSKELNEIKSDPKLLQYKKDNYFKARKITQVKLTKVKGDYLKAKERYQTARKNYVAAQNGFKEAKTRFKECEGNNNSECNQRREEIKERAKEFLLKTADNILEHLNKVKANVESNEDLSEEEATEILGKIDEMIVGIEDAKSIIENSEDKESVIEAARTIKQAWLRVRKRLAIHTGRITNARIGGIIVKIKHLEVKLERTLARMEEKGIDTTEIQTLIDEFNVKIDEARDNYENALDKFKEAASAEDVEKAHELAVEGHRYMKAAHKSLQEAQKLLSDIVLSIKQKGGEEDLAAPEDEVEEEVEEEGEEDVEPDYSCDSNDDCELKDTPYCCGSNVEYYQGCYHVDEEPDEVDCTIGALACPGIAAINTCICSDNACVGSYVEEGGESE